MPRVEQVQQKALEEFRERNRAAAKRKKQTNNRQWGEALITFICLFFLLSLLFLQIAKKMTPKIDTSIGSNVVEAEEQTETKALIDDRLRIIKFDDAQAAEELRRQKEQEIFNEALDEKVVLPNSKDKAQKTEETQEEISKEQSLDDQVQNIINKNLKEVKTLDSINNDVVSINRPKAPVPSSTNVNTASTNLQKRNLDKSISTIQNSDVTLNQATNYKVFVGNYQTAEQAQLAKSIIRETALGQNAFVKFVDNKYTIQIGAYATAEQARNIAQELTTKSFPARVYYEKPVSTSTPTGKTIF